MKKTIQIVLVHPEIPPNTGNVARLCVCNDLVLHLIKPIGFSLNEKHVKRAGLDYWPHLKLKTHNSWKHFLEIEQPNSSQLFLFSAKGKKNMWDILEIPTESYLVFGSETNGLPKDVVDKNQAQLFQIPMLGSEYRCLNLSTSVGIGAYEFLKRIHVSQP